MKSLRQRLTQITKYATTTVAIESVDMMKALYQEMINIESEDQLDALGKAYFSKAKEIFKENGRTPEVKAYHAMSEVIKHRDNPRNGFSNFNPADNYDHIELNTVVEEVKEVETIKEDNEKEETIVLKTEKMGNKWFVKVISKYNKSLISKLKDNNFKWDIDNRHWYREYGSLDNIAYVVKELITIVDVEIENKALIEIIKNN